MAKWKGIYLWVSEDLLYLRWSKAEKDWRDSIKNSAFIEVANIKSIKIINDNKFTLFLKDDPEHDLCFDLIKGSMANQWVKLMNDLMKDDLAYRLQWDNRDQGTELSLHWSGDDKWFPGTILNYDEGKLFIIKIQKSTKSCKVNRFFLFIYLNCCDGYDYDN